MGLTANAKARSIPALAGEPSRGSRGSGSRWGLSPRLRGNLAYSPFVGRIVGSIPALAGEPLASVLAGIDSLGLSPRLRGNLLVIPHTPIWGRSIPALAGEPPARPSVWSFAEVYPRACGGTPAGRQAEPGRRGLSPRLRGNPLHQPTLRPWRRSIPALAGEPNLPRRTAGPNAVYPRACGGTGETGTISGANAGLSPRLRGNPNRPLGIEGLQRSIPALAGEPH